MSTVVISAIGVGLALVGLIRAVRPARPSAAAMLLVLDRATNTPVRRQVDTSRSRITKWANPHRVAAPMAAELLVDRGWLPEEVSTWIRAAGSSLEELLAQVILGAMAGLLVPVSVAVAGPALGARVPWPAILALSIALSGVGLAAPLVALRTEARRARREARTVVGSFLDLVVLGLAGGMGIESALHEAARISDHPFSARLANALDLARHSGQTPWSALAELGNQLGVNELAELAASVALAGMEGARVRSTLAAKAASIRRHEMADAETEANALTERLFLPGVFLLVGFLLFVGYPAVARISGGF